MARRHRRGSLAEESRSCLAEVAWILVAGFVVWLFFASGGAAWLADTLAHSVTFKP